MTLAFAGFLAGFVHVLSGPDHLAAIAPYAVDERTSAWRTGVRWGLGHTAGVLGVAVMALLLRHALPIERLSAWGERCVGLVLIAIGIWGARAALTARTDNGRDHRHAHADGHDHLYDRGQAATTTYGHGRAAFAVGTLHGLARQLAPAGNPAGAGDTLRSRRRPLPSLVRHGQRRRNGNLRIVRRLDCGLARRNWCQGASGVAGAHLRAGRCSRWVLDRLGLMVRAEDAMRRSSRFKDRPLFAAFALFGLVLLVFGAGMAAAYFPRGW